MSEHDPFPRERVSTTLKRVPAYVRLSWRLARDPLLSKARRAGVIAAAGYLASPIDLVPGVIPVLGQLDDLAVAIAALRLALAGLDPERRRQHLESVGLADDHLAEDVRTLGVTSAWMVRAGVRTGGRAARTGAQAAAKAGPTVKTVIVKAGPAAGAAAGAARSAAGAAGSAASKAAPAAKSVASKATAAKDKAAPAAKVVADKAAPVTRAAGKAGSGAKSAAGRGIAAAKGLARKQPGMSVRVSVRRPPALGPGGEPDGGEPDAGERLDVEPDAGA